MLYRPLDVGSNLERHPLAVFAGIDGGDVLDRDRQRLGDAVETCRKGDQFVAHHQLMRRFRSEIQDDLSVLDMLARNPGAGVDAHPEIRRKALIQAPLMDRAYQVCLLYTSPSPRDS